MPYLICDGLLLTGRFVLRCAMYILKEIIVLIDMIFEKKSLVISLRDDWLIYRRISIRFRAILYFYLLAMNIGQNRDLIEV